MLNIDHSPIVSPTGNEDREESIGSAGRDKAIIEAEYPKSIEKVIDHDLHERTNHSKLTLKGGTICCEVMTRQRKSLMKQSMASHSAVNSKTSSPPQRHLLVPIKGWAVLS